MSCGAIYFNYDVLLPFSLRLIIAGFFEIEIFLILLLFFLSSLHKLVPKAKGLLELLLLSYSCHTLISVYLDNPTRPYWFIDACIEHHLDPELIFSFFSAGCILLVFFNFFKKHFGAQSLSHLSLMTLILFGLSFLKPSSLFFETLDVFERLNQPHGTPPSSAPSPEHQKREDPSQAHSKSEKKEESDADQPPPPPKERQLAFMRFFNYVSLSDRLNALYFGESSCSLYPAQLPLSCTKELQYTEQASDFSVTWERFDLVSEIDSRLWLLTSQVTPPAPMDVNHPKIYRGYRGVTRLPTEELRLNSYQKLIDHHIFDLKDEAVKRTPSTEISTHLAHTVLDEQVRLTRLKETQVLLKTPDEYQTQSDMRDLRAILDHFSLWTYEKSEAPLDEEGCTKLTGTRALQLYCLATSLRSLGIATRVVKGYKVPQKNNSRQKEILITTSHLHDWIEVFTYTSSGDALGWRVIDPLEQDHQSAQPEPDLHSKKQLISHWIDQAKRDAHQHTNEHTVSVYFALSLFALLLIFIIDRIIIISLLMFGKHQALFEISLVYLSYLNLKRGYGESRAMFTDRVTSRDPNLGQCLSSLTNMYNAHHHRSHVPTMRRLTLHLLWLISVESMRFKASRFQLQSITLRRIDQPKRPH